MISETYPSTSKKLVEITILRALRVYWVNSLFLWTDFKSNSLNEFWCITTISTKFTCLLPRQAAIFNHTTTISCKNTIEMLGLLQLSNVTDENMLSWNLLDCLLQEIHNNTKGNSCLVLNTGILFSDSYSCTRSNFYFSLVGHIYIFQYEIVSL